MEKILVLAGVEADGSLGRAALEAFAAGANLARELAGATLECGLIGAETVGAARRLAGLRPAKLWVAEGEPLAQARYSTDAAAIEAIAKASGASVIIAPATARLSRVMAGVARRLNGAIDAHASEICVVDGRATVARWYYRKRMEGRLQRSSRPWVITLDPGAVAPWDGAPGDVSCERVALDAAALETRTRVEGERAPEGGADTIRPDADLLFVAGAGWTKPQADGAVHLPEAQSIIVRFLELTGASLGSSKSLVDLGSEGQSVLPFMTHLNQIGQTGQTPRHPKGLSTCCHGEEPHTVGWRFIDERRAIGLDANCGWAQGKADVLYVADAFAVISRVNELLAAKKG